MAAKRSVRKKRPDRRTLIVMDMLRGFFDPRATLYCGPSARAIIPYVRRKILAYARRGDPVIFSCDRHAKNDPEFKTWPPHCVKGTWEAEISPQVPVPEGAHLVSKTTINPFYRTALDRVLSRTKPDLVEVVGVCTNICILYAALELKVRGYAVRVPSRGVTTFDRKAHQRALDEMRSTFGIKVV